jgi:uncharacterized delta-60 repeat protein
MPAVYQRRADIYWSNGRAAAYVQAMQVPREHLLDSSRRPAMRKPARSALAALFASGLLIAMAAAAANAEAAGGPGTLDPSFGTGGTVLTSLAGANQEVNQALVSDAALASNGDIVASGSFGLARYLPDGKLDTSFGAGGFAQTGFGAAALAIQPNGEFVVAGQSGNDFAVARLTTTGALDPAFGHGGVVTTAFPNAADGAAADAVLVEPDGDILVGGEALVPGTTRNQPVLAQGALALYNPSGTLVSSFGSGGLVQAAAVNTNITTLGTDASGDIFTLPAHAEFSTAGQLDSSVTAEPITASSHGGTGAFLPNGQSLIGGTVGLNRGATDVQVQRFNANGSTDPTFTNPPFVFATPGDHESPAAIAVAPNGQIVVVGAHFRGTSVFGVARLDSGGSLDSSFANAGVTTTNFQGNDIAEAVVVQPNGDIIAIGSSEDNTTGAVDVALARYLG